MRNTFILIVLLSMFYVSCKSPGSTSGDANIDRRVDSVMALMSLDDKIGQLNLLTSDWDVTGPTFRKDYEDLIRQGKIGAIFNAHTAAYTRKLQKMAMEESKLKIPLLFGYDVIHGYKTIFPVPLAEAASWDLVAIEKSARIAAIEAAASGLHWTFAPMVDIARDPRWGRVMEGSGEDAYLGSLIGAARVRGFQGKDLTDPLTILACAKHYAAYGAAQAGRDYHTVDMSELVLREVYLPPFKAALDAGVATYMTSFNELFGIPASASQFLLRDVLKKEWNFSGFVVTDYTSINEMVEHGYAVDHKHGAELALNAGVDMDMQGTAYLRFLKELVDEKKVTVAQIDDAVRRILKLKFQLGLFDDPYRYSDEEREKQLIYAPEHLDAARDIARKSFVLLKNNNQTLPFGANVKNVALIGPLGDTQHHILGTWRAAGDNAKAVSLLMALQQETGFKVVFEKGCDIEGTDKSGFAKAIAAARAADIIVLAIGETAEMSGEAACRTNISIPGVQSELLAELRKLGKPIVLVLMNGRPITIEKEVDMADAVLETWFAGTQAGYAIADVLTGRYNPSGKLPITFPRNVGQIPIFYNMKNTGRPISESKYTSKYLDVSNTPLFPFGFGLSYTTFAYSNLALSDSLLHSNDSIVVSVKLANTGNFDGEEVVQLYVRDLVGNVTRPVKELKGYKKVFLKKGEEQTISFTIKASDLAFYHSDLTFKPENGDFMVFVGGNSVDVINA